MGVNAPLPYPLSHSPTISESCISCGYSSFLWLLSFQPQDSVFYKLYNTVQVAELEEQLKFVSLQREKAEKATGDILVILKNHGIGDVSEEFDSSSEQEEDSQDFKARNGSLTMEETSTNVKLSNNEKEAYSSSEIESSPSTGRSLSWKSTRDSQHSFEKRTYVDSVRRRGSFSSNSSSSRRVGKSCRRIKRRDTR